MSRELRICPGVGSRKCGAFLSTLDRDPHPTCTRCRGKVCTKDMTCDVCADLSAAQWEQFVKKRSYKERKKPSRLSGLFHLRRWLLPARKLLREFCSLGLLPLLFPALEVGRGRGMGLGVHLVLCPEGLPPLPLDLGPARGVGVSLNCRLLHASALPLLQLLRELEKGELLGRSGLPLSAPLPRSSLPIPCRTLDDVGN